MSSALQSSRRPHVWALLFAAWILSLAASLSVLFVGEIMGQAPCNLCWFQRAFMFPLVLVLGMASLRSDAQVWSYVWPLTAAGASIAAFHSLLYFGVVPERIKPCGATASCTSSDMTILGGLPLPLLALAAFIAIAALAWAARSKATS